MTDLVPLWHFTCYHASRRIARTALRPLLVPQQPHPMTGLPPLLWLTVLPEPDREATGLTTHTISCDRMDFRYQALRTAGCVPWLESEFRASANRAWLAEIELPGHDPEHWYVTGRPVPVRWDRAWTVARIAARPSAAKAREAS